MPAVDLSQLPEPAIIAEPDFEAILADTKAMMIASYPAEQREAVSAALELESEPLNVIAQTMSFREMLLRQRVNEGARACMLSHSAGTDLDNLAGNMNTKRLVITPATDTTDAVMESDTSLRLRAQRAYDGLSVAGPSGAYEYFARSASGLVRDARAISPSPANVTVSILSTEGDGTATEALLNTVRAVLNAEDTRPVADRLTVQSARIVTWRLNAKLYFYPGPETPVCIVFDYPRTLAQRSLPVGLRSLLMREYSDDTAHQQNLFQALSTDIFLRPFQLLLHRHQPLSEGEIIPCNGVCQLGAGCIIHAGGAGGFTHGTWTGGVDTQALTTSGNVSAKSFIFSSRIG